MISTDRQYFRNMYATSDDPWDLKTSSYESRKYGLTLDTLTMERYHNAFEPGCSIGVLSELLAPRCDRLLATDIIPSALAQAARRLEKHRNVVVEQRAIPEAWPNDTFDLGVIVSLVVRSTAPGAHVVGVHWRGDTDYPLTGDGAHEVINAHIKLRKMVHHLEKEFVIDLWERV